MLLVTSQTGPAFGLQRVSSTITMHTGVDMGFARKSVKNPLVPVAQLTERDSLRRFSGRWTLSATESPVKLL
jgi:hypothetical protein